MLREAAGCFLFLLIDLEVRAFSALPLSGHGADFPGAHVLSCAPPQANLSFLLYFCVIKDAMYGKVPTVNIEGK